MTKIKIRSPHCGSTAEAHTMHQNRPSASAKQGKARRNGTARGYTPNVFLWMMDNMQAFFINRLQIQND